MARVPEHTTAFRLKASPVQLTTRGAWHRLDDSQLPWPLCRGEATPRKFEQLRQGGRPLRISWHHNGDNPLAPLGIGTSHDGNLRHARIATENLFDFGGLYRDATGQDPGRRASRHPQVTLRIDVAEVTGMQPALIV